MKISFCTTCMDRLFHLKDTFLKNVDCASSCSDCEFVLLNYNSKDGLHDWAMKNLGDLVNSGRVSYYLTRDPIYFVSSHAKNIAHRLATGDILCNLDSDVFIPRGFCEFLHDVFEKNQQTIISFESKDANGSDGCAGLIASMSKHFYSVNGYDEDIYMGWGYDDMNYQFRCRMHNGLRLLSPDGMCSCIPHSNEVRTKNFQLKDIPMSVELSMSICHMAAEGNYVANREREWGIATLFKNFSDIPLGALGGTRPPEGFPCPTGARSPSEVLPCPPLSLG